MSACTVCKKGFGPGIAKISAMGKTFHKECFVCKDCKKPFTNGDIYEVDGKLLCGPCAETPAPAPAAATSGGPTCKICGKGFTGSLVRAFGFTFHAACMVCQVCKKPIKDDGFFDEDTDQIMHLDCLMKI